MHLKPKLTKKIATLTHSNNKELLKKRENQAFTLRGGSLIIFWNSASHL